MKRLVWIGIAITSILAGACSENPSPPPAIDRVPPPAVSTAAPTAHDAGGPSAAGSAQPGISSTPVPPAGAQWTIFCGSFRGPDHVLIANQAKQDLLAQSRLSDWYLVHHEDESILYYGYYTALTTPRAKSDKHAIDQLTTPSGDREFATSMFVPLSSPNPTAPAEWDLANTPADMYWSLQIAAFVETPDRKERAVQAVRDARAAGVEAYYYHGETVSSVCIGAWPRAAVRQQSGGAVAHNDNPDVPVIVSNVPIPDGAVPKLHDDQGRPIPVMAPELVVDDPTLAKAIHDWPDHAVNGANMGMLDQNKKQVLSPSFLVIIPHKSAVHDADDPDAPRQAPARVTSPADGTDSTLGKLRTIGEH
jgi:hypothetical protein